MTLFKKTKSLVAILIATFATLWIVESAHSQTVGAGVSILNKAGANNAVDTPSTGTTDQSRQNVDITYTADLNAGQYTGVNWTFRAGQVGSVIPYLAVSTGAHSYKIVAVGSQVDIGQDKLNVDITAPFGGSPFTLASTAKIFGGIVNPTGAGSQNPILTNLASGGQMDHDNNNDGKLSPAVVGGTVDGLGFTNLPRSYAFSINLRAVPEPSAALSVGIFTGIAGLVMRRRLARK